MIGSHTFQSMPFELLLNSRHGVPGVTVLPAAGFRRAKAAITTWPGYVPTPLLSLSAITGSAIPGSGLRGAKPPGANIAAASVSIKDEGARFGLGSFKALGGAYALANLLAAELSRRGTAQSAMPEDLASGKYQDATRAITVTCATDGNHGRSVAWGAQRFHCRCVIFVHETVSQGRVEAISRFGAEVVRVPGNYDDAVREADRQAREQHWFVVSDTSYPGYTEVPRDVMQGYRLMADEAADQWTGPPPTHVFIQAGVGGAAAAVSVQMRARFTPAPLLVLVEPDHAACLLASAKAGAPTVVRGDLETVMAGLACGEPSLLAWQELERAAFAFMAIPDDAAIGCLRLLAAEGIEVGESGVAGLAGFLLAAADPEASTRLRLSDKSRILLFGTEGVTDRAAYDKIRG
jgi:diaminopropionate ammonia-lyase